MERFKALARNKVFVRSAIVVGSGVAAASGLTAMSPESIDQLTNVLVMIASLFG